MGYTSERRVPVGTLGADQGRAVGFTEVECHTQTRSLEASAETRNYVD